MAVCAILVLLGVPRAEAGDYRARFHLLTDRLSARLSAPARRNAASVAAFPKATGFVVGSDRAIARRILVMTNFHVAGEGVPAGQAITFGDGTVAAAGRTVAANPRLDYALVEAELRSGPRASGVAPLALDRSVAPMKPGRELYSVAGHVGLAFDDPARSLAGGKAAANAVASAIADGKARKAGPVGFRTIAPGRVLAESQHPIVVKLAHARTLGVLSEMPNAGGMSGSPVFARDSHLVVGLHFSGSGATTDKWEQSSAPMNLVLRDLGHRLQRGQVDPAGRDLVEQLVDPTSR